MPTETNLPLSGIRVVDLGWLTAGAATGTLLCDLGANVIKVEGPSALDPFRRWEGADLSTDWWNQSLFYNFTNRGKCSLCLDLKDPRGREILLRVLENSDILIENFRRGVMASFGLDPPMLRAKFARLIIASISSQGETGPDRNMVSYGSTLEATGGLAALTGTGRDPVVSGRDINYPDQVVCLFAANTILAALVERDRTGHGAYLDLSQRELTSFLLGEELIAAAAGSPSPRRGNHDPDVPTERVECVDGEWRVAGPDGTVPVRHIADVIAAPEFSRSTALLCGVDGKPTKGFPFRLGGCAMSVRDTSHGLGADNRAVLLEAGYKTAEIADFEAAGIIATAPSTPRLA